MKVGIFGGTFDPIHIGHIAMAIAIKEAHHLDRIYFVPAHLNPLKPHRITASPQGRVEMLEIALRDFPGGAISLVELEREPPSYMIDTVKQLIEKAEPSTQFFLLLGKDLLSEVTHWKSCHELFSLAPPLIASRSEGNFEGEWMNDPILKPMIEKGFTSTPLFDMSSTDVRKRLSLGLFCGHLLDSKVLTYIQQQGLYHK